MNTILDDPQHQRDLPYEVLVGAPTITFATDEGSLSLPYSALNHTSINPAETEIQFEFTAFIVLVSGRGLKPLWRRLQTQDVLEVKQSSSNQSDGCVIESIEVTAPEFDSRQF